MIIDEFGSRNVWLVYIRVKCKENECEEKKWSGDERKIYIYLCSRVSVK
jgi:hypothetical protein